MTDLSRDPEPDFLARLAGIQEILKGVHEASQCMSSAVKGTEREGFVEHFLSEALPPSYRVGQGDIIDQRGTNSGQVDVVVTLPFFPQPPPLAKLTRDRLFLAEGVAAVIEVKSDIDRQWEEATRKAGLVRSVRRSFGGTSSVGQAPLECIPFFVVGYKGKGSVERYSEKLDSAPVDGILVIDPGIFVSNKESWSLRHEGPGALWALICCLHWRVRSLIDAGADLLAYAPSRPKQP